MAWISCNLNDVWVFEPKIWYDTRGYFIESFNASTLPSSLQHLTFVQDNEAKSTKGVLRGLHFQIGDYAQSKLVRCVSGEVLDVIVDLRSHSPTYGQHLSVILNEINKKQLFVPKGFAHGYIVLSETAIFAYKCDAYYAPGQEGGVRYNDATLNIDWMLDDDMLLVSPKDQILPLFGDHIPFT